MPTPNKDPWTRALRHRVYGSAVPHKLDSPRLVLDLATAWSTLRATAQHAPALRAYKGDPAWVARCHQVERELTQPSAPTQLDLGVEYAREQVLFAMLLDARERKALAKPLIASLAALRMHVGGARFVIDFFTQPPPLSVMGEYTPGASYTLTFDANPGPYYFATPSMHDRWLSYQALRRHFFALPEADFARAAEHLRDQLPLHTDAMHAQRWEHVRAMFYLLGRDPTLAEPYVTRGLQSAESLALPPLTFDRFCVDSMMLGCLRDPALTEAIVARRIRDLQNISDAELYVADMVNTMGAAAVPTLEAFSRGFCKGAIVKLLAELLSVSRAL